MITKSLTTVVLAGAFALPFIASSAYGRTTTQTNSRSIGSSDTTILAATNTASQKYRKCRYQSNTDISATWYVASCMKEGTLKKIHPSLRNTSLRNILKLARGTYGSSGGGVAHLNGSDTAKQAYAVLANEANRRPPGEWAK